jgi:hypothetical protein
LLLHINVFAKYGLFRLLISLPLFFTLKLLFIIFILKQLQEQNCFSGDQFKNYFSNVTDRSEEKQCFYFEGPRHVNQNTGICFA